MIKRIIYGFTGFTVKLVFIAAGIIICLPVLMVVTGSVMGESDLLKYLAPVFRDGKGFVG